MKEINLIINTYESIDWATTKAALATVVRVEGSSYRRTGARMLVLDNGNWVGGISGGCLEGDALKRAKLAIYKSESSLITYDTTTDDPHQIGVGLGCNGIIEVLFCPLDPQDKNNPVEILKSAIFNNRKATIILTTTGIKGNWAELKVGNALIYNRLNDLEIFGNQADLIQKLIFEQVSIGHSAPKQLKINNEQSVDLFIEILPPEIHLVLFGHQYDVYPLAILIKEIGWNLTIVANPLKVNNLFSKLAHEIVSIENLDLNIFDPFSAAILMAHDYKTDKHNLSVLLKSNCTYIGMLGPKVRSEKIFQEFELEGIKLLETDFERIFAPVGLDIGAISPEEIALSILAEIRAVFSNRKGGSLNLRDSTIHERA
jgi:xanthine dehydrogenase accessory factor